MTKSSLPPTVYGSAVPLTRAAFLSFLHAEVPDVRGAFVAFLMTPVEPRIGRWSAVAAESSLEAMVDALGRRMHEVGFRGENGRDALERLTNDITVRVRGIKRPVRHAIHYDSLPLATLGEHRVVVYAEGDAPFDDLAFCVLEVADLEIAQRCCAPSA